MRENLTDVALDGVELGPSQILDLLGDVFQIERVRKPATPGKIPQGGGLLLGPGKEVFLVADRLVHGGRSSRKHTPREPPCSTRAFLPLR
jgi:hypothetical protein